MLSISDIICVVFFVVFVVKTGLVFFDVWSSLLEAISDFVVSFILLSIGSGWTLNTSSSSSSFQHPYDSSSSSPALSLVASLKKTFASPAALFIRPSMHTMLFVLLFAVHVVLVLWSALGFADDFDKFHDHEHLPGKILMWFRLGSAILFCLLSTNTMNHDLGGDMKFFMRLFRTVGCAWFACMPIFVFVAEFFAQYLRHPIITGGTLMIQSLTLTVMAWLFVGSKSTLYYARSTVGQSSSSSLGGFGGLGLSAGLDSGTKKEIKVFGLRTHCD